MRSEGILGTVAGIVGTIQANEVLKKILNIGTGLDGYIFILDLLHLNFRKVKLKKRKNCFVDDEKNSYLVFMFINFRCTILNAEEKFLSLKKNKTNVRYGPGLDYPIKYIYRKVNLPVKQIDKKENWRRVIFLDNNSGWIHWSQLKPSNSIITIEEKILFKKPSNFSEPLAKLEKGRLLVIKKCEDKWCNITTDDYKGWVKIKNIWGSTK